MSFINLMANDDWSDADIVNRTEAMITSQFPRWMILQRKVMGQMEGQYTLTADESSEYNAYKAYAFQMGADADQARSDMDLLRRTWAVSTAQQRLALPAVDGDDEDAAERQSAQAVLDAAAPDALNLATQRAQVTQS